MPADPPSGYSANVSESVLVGLAAALTLIGTFRLFAVAAPASLALALLAGLAIPAGRLIRMAWSARERPPPKFAWAAAAVAIGGVALAFVPDTSWDGMAYHFPSILRVASGWNPLLSPADIALANLYPNGAWTLLAAAGTLVGSLDAGRILKLPLVAVSAYLLSRLLSNWVVRPERRWLLALALIGNPVVMAQLWTFYLDDVVYLLTVCCFCLCAQFLAQPGWRAVVPLCASVLILSLTKLYGAYYAGVALLAAACLGWRPSMAAARIAVPAGFIVGALIVFLGWRPFATAWSTEDLLALPEHHPIARERPANLYEPPHLLVFPISMFSATGGVKGESVRPKPPFVLAPREIYFIASPDPRAGGFGPFYSGACLLGLLLWTEAARSRAADPATKRRVLASGLAVSGVVLAACMAFPVNWWARMVPVGWVLPLVPAVLCEILCDGRRAGGRWLMIGVIGLSLANAGLAFFGNGARTLYRWADIRSEIATSAAVSGPLGLVPAPTGWMHVTMTHWLDGLGYEAHLVEAADCKSPVLNWRRMQVCLQ